MSPDPSIPDRLKAGSPGLGAPDSNEIERRAVELAMIDGRQSFTDADLAQAAAELAGGTADNLSPEADAPIVEDLETWDEPVEQHGRQVEETALEDEAAIDEELIADGLDDADHSQRVAAAEESEEDAE